MPKTSPLSASELSSLACPYCGRQLPAGTEWLGAAEAQWGSCGVKLTQDDGIAAVLAFAPTARADEAMVKMIWVRPELAGRGYGRHLVQAAAADMVRHKMTALRASGARGRHVCASAPIGFLQEVGFTLPVGERLWRLDLRKTVLERKSLRLLERLFGGLGANPEPAGGAISPRMERRAQEV
jgi:GNAT superfamily N-acetyltransferase